MKWALLFQAFCLGDLLLAHSDHMLSENCCAPSLAAVSGVGCCCRGFVPWAWLLLPKSGHLHSEDGWGAGGKGQVTEGFLLLYLYCSLQMCCRLPCIFISRAWKGISRYVLKQVMAIGRREKTVFLAVWLYPWYPVQESSFAINHPPAEWPPFPVQALLGCPQEQRAGRAGGSSCCSSQPAVMEMHVQAALC